MANTALLFLSLFLFAAAVAAAPTSVRLNLKSGPSAHVGVFFVGNETLARLGEEEIDFEVLKEEISPQSPYASHNAQLHHAFVLRSSTFRFRIKVAVFANEAEDEDVRPYVISFKNMAREDESGVELKHGESGWVWIDAGLAVEHATDIGHNFILHDYNHNEMVTVSLDHAVHTEL